MTEGREPQASQLLPGGSRHMYQFDIITFILYLLEK